jgi:3-oxoacyl-[acyl-carrier-protein] synthase II
VAEANAIRRAFGSLAGTIPVSATKSMTGHLLGAAGALEAIFTILALHHRLAPRRSTSSTSTRIASTSCAASHRTLPLGDMLALDNSFGFGGHNVALAFRSV